MRELKLDQLRSLVTIADLGSFSAAARALHLAQPTISLHINELEERFSAPLLIRNKRRVEATHAGMELIRRARLLLQQADDTEQAIEQALSGKKGKVRVGTSTGALVHLLPEVLRTMERRFPDIDVQIRVLGSNDTLTQLEQSGLDVGLVSFDSPVHRPDIVMQNWCTHPMMAFVPQDWISPKHATPHWLAERPLIFNDPTTQMYRLTMEWFGQAGYSPRARIELNHTEAMLSLVGAGYGAAIMPLESEWARHRRSGVQVLPLRPTLTRTTLLAHRKTALLNRAALNFIEVLNQHRAIRE